MTYFDRQPIPAGIFEVLKPVLYADIFDFPLTLAEVYRFVETPASFETVQGWLAAAVCHGELAVTGQYYHLPHRPALPDRRRERAEVARRLWGWAQKYGRRLAALPFVRLVAVTGALAVDNPKTGVDDIDYLIVTQPGRLWLCRAMMLLLVRYARLGGVQLCPNYIITTNALHFEQNLFAAREILQMKPLYGPAVYRQICEANAWVNGYFPQGFSGAGEPVWAALSSGPASIKQWGEFGLGQRGGDSLERRLQTIQATKHQRRAAAHASPDTMTFTTDVCKGHYDGHGQATLTAYQERLAALARRN